MMKLRILLLNLLVVYTIHFMAQESYSNDVTCVKADDNIAVITASGTAEKKKDVYNMALKSIFNAIFLNGIDGVENGQPLVGKEDSYYMNQFFSSRYMLFVKNYETVGDLVRQSSNLYKGTVTAQILLGALKKDLIRNKLMTRSQEEMSMEETRQQMALPTIMVVPYKSNDRSSYADILKNDFDLRIAVSTVKEGFVKLGVKTVAAEGKQSGTLRASEWESKVPENKSASQGKNMAARELIKRLNREFARELKKITFDRTGKIPERQKMLPDVPVPVVGSSVPEKEADPVISVPVVVPEVIPAPLVPVKSAKPENQKAIRVEWLDGVFVEFDKLATLGDKSRIHLKIVNTNADDCEVDLYSGNLTVINEKGEESPIVSLKLGSKFNDRRVTALIVPDLPTEMVIEVSKLQSVALLQLKDFKNNIVKLRGLK